MKYLALLLLATPLFADGPKYQSRDPYTQQEFQNVYHDIKYPSITYGSASSMTITSLNVSSLTVSNFGSLNFGKVLRVLQYTSTTASSNATSSFLATNLQGTITLQNASNRVLIIAMGTLASNGSTNAAKVAATLAGTAMGDLGGTAGMVANDLATASGSYVGIVPATLVYLDSPGTTATQTYSVKIKAVSGTTTAQWGTGSTLQTLILVELAP